MARTAALGLVVWLGGCAAPPLDLPNAAQLEILIPEPEFAALGRAADWTIAGIGHGERTPRLTASHRDGQASIRLSAGGNRLIAVRQMGALLPATPFLTWAWHLSPTPAEQHPVRLIVGFRIIEERSARQRQRSRDPDLPDHQRLLSLVFSASALQRGGLARAPGTADGGVYIVSGGRENSEAWCAEAVDLEALYRGLWPGDDTAWVEVAFIGVTAEASTAREAGDLRDIGLIR